MAVGAHRNAALDGLRGLAIVLVLVCHIDDVATITGGRSLGSAGVTAFFTLSGFLITSLLLADWAAFGRIRLRHFYARRARRLLPAVAVVLLVVGTFEIAAGFVAFSGIPPVALYYANSDGAAGHDHGLLPHAWSLAIEEQFYIVWPFLLLLVRRWRWGVELACGAGIAASLVLRYALWNTGDNPYRVYVGTDTRADGLLVGCLLACFAYRGLRPISGTWGTVSVAAMIAVGLADRSVYGTDVLLPTIAPWLTALAIWAALSSAPRWMSDPRLRYLGRRSYAIYLWHFALLLAITNVADSIWMGVVAVIIAIGVAELSWIYVESPFLTRSGGALQGVTRGARPQRGKVSSHSVP